MKDDERDAAVQEHLEALDSEIARLRRMEAEMDRRLRAIDGHVDPVAEEADEPLGGR